MIRVNIDEAEARFEELIEAVETKGEIVMLCRDGVEVAELVQRKPKQDFPRLRIHPELQGKILYDPLEPATEADWPTEPR